MDTTTQQALDLFERVLVEYLESISPEERTEVLTWLEAHAEEADLLAELIKHYPPFALRFTKAVEAHAHTLA